MHPSLLTFIDFDGLRPGASPKDLPLGGIQASVEVLALPSPAELPPGHRSEDYVEALVPRLPPESSLLVGFCVGASIAVQLAALLEATGRRSPILAVIDPAEITDTELREEAKTLLSRLGSGAELPPGPTNLRFLLAAVDRAYDRHLSSLPVVERDLFVKLRGEIVDRYASWLAFVAAARGQRPGPPLPSPHVVFSQEGVLDGLPEWIDSDASVVAFDIPRDELLASTELASWLTGLASGKVA